MHRERRSDLAALDPHVASLMRATMISAAARPSVTSAGGPAKCVVSFEQLVGANEQRQRHLDPELFRGLQVDQQLDLGGLLDR
jgi:hypothetical protein